jgi:hypothetical protein
MVKSDPIEPGFRSRDFMGKNLWLELE